MASLAFPKPQRGDSRRKRRAKKRALREAGYLAWIHERPCVVCGTWPVEAHHERDLGAGDAYAVPLCPGCHRTGAQARHALKSRRRFEAVHGVDLGAIIAAQRAEYGG